MLRDHSHYTRVSVTLVGQGPQGTCMISQTELLRNMELTSTRNTKGLLRTTHLTRVRATDQEERNKPESSAAKLYCLHLQEQESKSKRSIAYIFRSQSARAQECKRARARARERKWRNPVPF